MDGGRSAFWDKAIKQMKIWKFAITFKFNIVDAPLLRTPVPG